jgi:polar amino acid transport system substrate-binding protein
MSGIATPERTAMPARPCRRAVLALPLALLALLPAPQALADALAAALDRGSLRIGVSAFVPWTIERPTGGLAGFDIDVGEKIAADMGLEPDFRLYPWTEIIPALEAGEIDLIAAGMAITPERALRVAFTGPYLTSGIAVAANTAMTDEAAGLAGLDAPGIVLATTAGSLADALARGLFLKAEIRAFADATEAERAVLTGDAHALVASLPEARFLALANPAAIALTAEEPLIGSAAGLAVAPHEQRLLNFLDAWIVARRADRWLDRTHAYWFETLDWMDRVRR